MTCRKQFSVWLGFALAILCLALAAAEARAEEVQFTEQTKGCVMHGWDMAHDTPFFNYFVKVAPKEYDSDDGKSEIWGYDPQDQSDHGKPRVVNVLEERFVRAGSGKPVGGHFCKCPGW